MLKNSHKFNCNLADLSGEKVIVTQTRKWAGIFRPTANF